MFYNFFYIYYFFTAVADKFIIRIWSFLNRTRLKFAVYWGVQGNKWERSLSYLKIKNFFSIFQNVIAMGNHLQVCLQCFAAFKRMKRSLGSHLLIVSWKFVMLVTIWRKLVESASVSLFSRIFQNPSIIRLISAN